MFHMDSRFAEHNFEYSIPHSQYYQQPYLWTPPQNLPHDPSTPNTTTSHQSRSPIYVKREPSDGESNILFESQRSNEDEHYINNNAKLMSQTETTDSVLPGITRGNYYYTGLVTPPDSSASPSPNISLYSVNGTKTLEGTTSDEFADFPHVYTPLSSYQPGNLITSVAVNDIPLSLHKPGTNAASKTPEQTTTSSIRGTWHIPQETVPLKQATREETLSPITSPVAKSDKLFERMLQDPRFIGHNFGYPVQQYQYYSHPSFWTPQHPLPYGPSSPNSVASHEVSFSVPVKREQSDEEELNRSSDSRLRSEGSHNHITPMPRTEASKYVQYNIAHQDCHIGLVTPPDSSASASINTSIDSSKSPDDTKLQSPATFKPIYRSLPGYQANNVSTADPVNSFPSFPSNSPSNEIHSNMSESTLTALQRATWHVPQKTFPSNQIKTEQTISPITPPLLPTWHTSQSTFPSNHSTTQHATSSTTSPISGELASAASQDSHTSRSPTADPDIKNTHTCHAPSMPSTLYTPPETFTSSQTATGQVISPITPSVLLSDKLKSSTVTSFATEADNETMNTRNVPSIQTTPCTLRPRVLSNHDTPDTKRTRLCYASWQLEMLQQLFLENPYPHADIIERLSIEMNVAERNLKSWFQNKRARTRDAKRRHAIEQAVRLASSLVMPTHPVPAPPGQTDDTTKDIPATQRFPEDALPFTESQGSLSLPTNQHGRTSSIHAQANVKMENIVLSPPSQRRQHASTQSSIPFYQETAMNHSIKADPIFFH